ncbi:hypothetical protein [Limnoglobus roseus]|uniref:Uncharacterized protein n=1 Tax=Limnoglobus roseus TaxID=2598579 RepID=A0A5C1ARV7_9BACT|nr:hypothetical protein [Limnoglobus roseus]QEL20887.1 hypothetical protein PX52LOC_08008 [Limnoglobus roseus]
MAAITSNVERLKSLVDMLTGYEDLMKTDLGQSIADRNKHRKDWLDLYAKFDENLTGKIKGIGNHSGTKRAAAAAAIMDVGKSYRGKLATLPAFDTTSDTVILMKGSLAGLEKKAADIQSNPGDDAKMKALRDESDKWSKNKAAADKMMKDMIDKANAADKATIDDAVKWTKFVKKEMPPAAFDALAKLDGVQGATRVALATQLKGIFDMLKAALDQYIDNGPARGGTNGHALPRARCKSIQDEMMIVEAELTAAMVPPPAPAS